jgi:hypothetical protein
LVVILANPDIVSVVYVLQRNTGPAPRRWNTVGPDAEVHDACAHQMPHAVLQYDAPREKGSSRIGGTAEGMKA